MGQGFTRVHLIILCFLAVSYHYISGSDDEIIKSAIASEVSEQVLPVSIVESPVESRAVVTSDEVIKARTHKSNDYFLNLIQGAEVKIGIWHQNHATLDAVLVIKREEQVAESITLDDLRVLGWLAVKRGDFIYLHKDGFKDTLTFKLG